MKSTTEMKIYQKSSIAKDQQIWSYIKWNPVYETEREKNKKINRVCSRFSGPKEETTKCIPIDEWINKIWHIHTMDGYSDIKKNEAIGYFIIQRAQKFYVKWKNPNIKISHVV